MGLSDTDGILLGLGMTSLFMFGTKSSGGPTTGEITLTNILLPALLALLCFRSSLVPARRAAGLTDGGYQK